MKLPRDLAGERLARHLCSNWGYRRVHQVGSHIVLETDDPSHQRIAITAHRPLRIGTLASVLRVIATHKGISREDLLESL
jgi:predicted RNA binding protein YcfA (HicA-like mRNA interferase family)